VMDARRGFYRRWGWAERAGASDDYAAFDLAGVQLALYPMTLLGAEAAPSQPAPTGPWNGVTLAINVHDETTVDAVWARALEAGAAEIAVPQAREWGGYSGYIATSRGSVGRSLGRRDVSRQRTHPHGGYPVCGHPITSNLAVMSDADAEQSGVEKARWNTDANPAAGGDDYLFVAALNFIVRSFRRLRARLRL